MQESNQAAKAYSHVASLMDVDFVFWSKGRPRLPTVQKLGTKVWLRRYAGVRVPVLRSRTRARRLSDASHRFSANLSPSQTSQCFLQYL